ncbi:uncharacterized protein BDW47DRAFT_121099 [Aspergillus candidus]|uniref:Uncharacterized protein n=1 Tax=Aspergillus candidus TaxID=41067 RepID=A0A2I2EYW7_ASPCN|nr:hypothetical protein BDW47DRAFT_121099 [Aspergillus candidus]PLB33574.1 hypothetical protein BDW47DRAFT_121099 [Aspergillus candidus]
MDGDTRRMKHNDDSRFPARSAMSRRGRSGHPASAAHSERFRQSVLQPARGDPASLSQAAARPRMSTYMDYEYTDGAFPGPSLQGGGDLPQFPPALRDPQRQRQPQHPQQLSFAPYEPDMVYNIPQQGSAQGPYEVVPPYQGRPSAAMDDLTGQFGVPQYFPSNEPTGPGVPPGVGSPYLTSPLHTSYNPSGPIGRSTASQPFPTTMAEINPMASGGSSSTSQPPPPPLQHRPPPSQQPPQPPPQDATDPPNLNEAYAQFQQALRETFDHTRAGRLVEASRSLLEISEWLVTNAPGLDRNVGILRDDQVLYADRLQLWNDFNICWLAICQKQKDLIQEMLQSGRRPSHVSLLSGDTLESLGNELIQLCDRIESHGLVDYQMGIWEEEILSVLEQCLDLMENQTGMLHTHTTTAPATAA